jgi:hypothetical protein
LVAAGSVGEWEADARADVGVAGPAGGDGRVVALAAAVAVCVVAAALAWLHAVPLVGVAAATAVAGS